MIRAPEMLPFENFHMTLDGITIEVDGAACEYRPPFSDSTVSMKPFQIENEFQRNVAPKTPVVTQGKYECAPAALAILTGHRLFWIKRAMAIHGWRNDNRGTSYEMSRAAARALGFDMIWIPKKQCYELMIETDWNYFPDAILSVPSLNYKGRTHAVAWTNDEIVDPNIGYAGRKVYGPEWTPATIGLKDAEVILKPMSESEYLDLQDVIAHYTAKEILKELKGRVV